MYDDWKNHELHHGIIVKKIVSYFWNEPVIAASLAVLLAWFLVREGIRFSPDGWGYWEGSVSILHGRGYNYFGGQPIFWYPPLFPMFLALWQGVLGVSGATLRLALLACCGASAFLWTALFRRLFGDHRTWLHSVLIVAFVASFLAVCHFLLLSEPLQLVLQALLLLLITSILLQEQPPTTWSFWSQNFRLGLLVVLLLLCRNSSLAFFPAICLFLLFFTWRYVGLSRKVSFVSCFAGSFIMVLGIPLGIWYVLRKLLKQQYHEESHHFMWFDGLYSPEEYLEQLGEANVSFLGPGIVGLVLLVGLWGFLIFAAFISPNLRKQRQTRVVWFFLMFVLSSVIMLFLMINLTKVYDPLQGRYLWFVPLMLVGTALAQTTLMPANRWRWCILGFFVVLVSWQVFRAVTFAVYTPDQHGLPQTMPEYVSEEYYDIYSLGGRSTNLIKPEFSLSPDWYEVGGWFPGYSRKEGDLLLVGPPHFFWIDREHDEKFK